MLETAENNISDTLMQLFDEITGEMHLKHFDDYIVTIKNNTICVKHILCGCEREITNVRDLECHCVNPTTHEMRERIYAMTDGEYYLYDEYVSPHDPITLIHNKCGGAFQTTINKFFTNQEKCPDCATSWGEKKVRDWLIEHNIAHVKQYRFPDCRYKRTLPFDFYCPTLNTAIEYDGEQHFVPVERFGGIPAFKYRQECDQIKTRYCDTRGIRLIRIDKTCDLNIALQPLLDDLASRHNTYANDSEDFDDVVF